MPSRRATARPWQRTGGVLRARRAASTGSRRSISPSGESQAARAYPTASAGAAGRCTGIRAGPRSGAVGKVPVELARAGVGGSRLQMPLLDPRDRKHLTVVADREEFVGFHQLRVGDAALLHILAGVAQELDHPAA